MTNFDRVCELHKRISKHDATAIDEIETLEEAKEIIKMMEGTFMYYVLTYSMGLEGIISEIKEEKNTDKYKGKDNWFRAGVDVGLDDAIKVIEKYLSIKAEF